MDPIGPIRKLQHRQDERTAVWFLKDDLFKGMEGDWFPYVDPRET
jgi:hypothetical protein